MRYKLCDEIQNDAELRYEMLAMRFGRMLNYACDTLLAILNCF